MASDSTAPLSLCRLVRFEGRWYVGHFDWVPQSVTLEKSREMPGSGFRSHPVGRETLQRSSLMRPLMLRNHGWRR